MNSTHANSINTIEIIIKLNIPFRKSGVGYLCRSPFREDNSPSCYLVDNRWKDLATGEHGRTLDLVIKIFNCSVSEALKKVESLIGGSSERLMLNLNPTPKKESSTSEIIQVKPLQNGALCEYVVSRGIPIWLANQYVNEIYLTYKNKTTFYVGLKNESGGYSLRNKFLKRNFSQTDISFFKGKLPGITVFEGLFDFLSGLRMSEKTRPLNNIILNSTSNLQKALKKIKAIATPDFEIGLFLDADEAGRKATETIIKEFPQAIDYSWVYAQSKLKDLNEYLLMKLKQKKV